MKITLDKNDKKLMQSARNIVEDQIVGMLRNNNEMKEIKAIQEMHSRALCEETNLSEKQLRALLKRKVNIYLTAEEAVEYGIADIII